MKLKLLVGSMMILGLVGTCANAEIAKPQAAGNEVVTASNDTINFWENILNRNEDNAAGVVIGQKNHVSAYIATALSHDSKRGDTNGLSDAYTDVSDNNKGNTSLGIAATELYFDSQVTDWARAHVAMDYDPNFTTVSSGSANTEMFFTEAYAEMNNFRQGAPIWMFAKVGRQYVNFTSVQHTLIALPVTDILGLTNATAVTVGVANWNGLYADAYGYNGSPYNSDSATKYADSQNNIHGWGAEVGYAVNNATSGFNVFADYIGNILDSTTFQWNTVNFTGAGSPTTMDEPKPGIALHGDYHTGPLAFIADYVGMVSAFNKNSYSFDGHGANLRAYALEADYTFAAQHNQTISLGYQGTENAVQVQGLGATFPLPASRILVGYEYTVNSNIGVKFQYANDQDYSQSDYAQTNGFTGKYYGSGASNNSFIARLNVTF